jgi:hypothetical protein
MHDGEKSRALAINHLLECRWAWRSKFHQTNSWIYTHQAAYAYRNCVLLWRDNR